LVVKTLDLLIATIALAHGVPIYTIDTDYRLMKKAGLPLILA
jgi:predicted nucleic acid-binding protein